MLHGDVLPLQFGRLINAIKINSVSFITANNRNRWIKRRRYGMGVLIWFGNGFLRLSNSRIQMFTRVKEWQIWERESFKLLHGDIYDSGIWNGGGVYSDEIVGQSLFAHLEQNTLTSEMLYATGVEMRRAHSLYFSPLKDDWSHGDPHLANFIYEASIDRCRLIDFETRHDSCLSPSDRQSDDLLVLLLDLLGRVKEDRWLQMADSFIDGYGQDNVLHPLKLRLKFPKGFERVLWATRTNFLSDSSLRFRLKQLQATIDKRLKSIVVYA